MDAIDDDQIPAGHKVEFQHEGKRLTGRALTWTGEGTMVQLDDGRRVAVRHSEILGVSSGHEPEARITHEHMKAGAKLSED